MSAQASQVQPYHVIKSMLSPHIQHRKAKSRLKIRYSAGDTSQCCARQTYWVGNAFIF